MVVYILCFAISIVLLYYAESKKFRGKDTQISVAFALLIPCLLAGLRDKTIGTDVQVYVEQLFASSEASDTLLEFLQSGYSRGGLGYTLVADFEIGFVVLTFLIEKIFGSMNVLLFFIQALTIIPIYKGLRAMSATQPVWLGMAVYFLMFFNHTLNLMRQWIAMAFLFYAFQFLVNRDLKKYFIAVALAWLFHYSALLGVAILAVYQLVVGERVHHKAMKTFLLIMVGCLSLLSLDLFVYLLDVMGWRYGGYIDGNLRLMPNQLLYRVPILLLLIMQWKYLKKTNRHAEFYLVMLVYDIFASQLTSVFEQSGRLSLYFSEYYMLAYPAICMSSIYKDNRKVMRTIIICYLCVYWWYTYVYLGRNDTVPYVSIFG